MATRKHQHRRLATAALFLCFVVATMLVTFSLSNDRDEVNRSEDGPAEIDPVVPVAGGITHTVASTGDWDRAVQSARPGDVIRISANVGSRLVYRGNNDGSSGQGGDGTPGQPIVITAAPNVWVDPGNTNSGFGAVDVIAADHVHVVGVRVRNAQFGIRCMQCRGTAGHPVRFVGNTVTNIGHAGVHFAGHWSSHAPSVHGLIEGNTINHTGKTAARYGEGIYVGHGGTEWIDNTSDVVVRGNHVSHTGAEGIDIKPGTRTIVVEGNLIHDLSPIDGGAISAHYVNAIPNPHPHQLDHVVVRGNRIWNINLSAKRGSNDWAIWVGHGGVDIVDNVIWGLRNDGNRTRAVRVRATQNFGPHPIRIENNIFWTARGWMAEGQPSGAANVVASNNRGVHGGTVETVVASSAFVGPVPGIGSSGSADAGSGPGSAFALAGSTPQAATPPPAPAPTAPPATAPPATSPPATVPPTTRVPAAAPAPAPAAAPRTPSAAPRTAPSPSPVAPSPAPSPGVPSTPSPSDVDAFPKPGDPTSNPVARPPSDPGGSVPSIPAGSLPPVLPLVPTVGPQAGGAVSPAVTGQAPGVATGTLQDWFRPSPQTSASANQPTVAAFTGTIAATGVFDGIERASAGSALAAPQPVDALRQVLAEAASGSSGPLASVDLRVGAAMERVAASSTTSDPAFGLLIVLGLAVGAVGLTVRAAEPIRHPVLVRFDGR